MHSVHGEGVADTPPTRDGYCSGHWNALECILVVFAFAFVRCEWIVSGTPYIYCELRTDHRLILQLYHKILSTFFSRNPIVTFTSQNQENFTYCSNCSRCSICKNDRYKDVTGRRRIQGNSNNGKECRNVKILIFLNPRLYEGSSMSIQHK